MWSLLHSEENYVQRIITETKNNNLKACYENKVYYGYHQLNVLIFLTVIQLTVFASV